jgi:hypothetical protein
MAKPHTRPAMCHPVVEHYHQFLKLGLSEAEKRDLVEYLKSL